MFLSGIQVAALVPKSELDGEMGDSHVALQARLMSQALRKLSHSLSRSQTILLFINQVTVDEVESMFWGLAWCFLLCNYFKIYLNLKVNLKPLFINLWWFFLLIVQKILLSEIHVLIIGFVPCHFCRLDQRWAHLGMVDQQKLLQVATPWSSMHLFAWTSKGLAWLRRVMR